MESLLKNRIFIISFVLFTAWIIVTNTIQSLICPSMTNTELFLQLPNSFLLDFIECK